MKRLSGIVDLHHHILPAVDDGAPDLETAIAMARIAVEEGISTIVATPHALDGVYDVDRSAAQNAGRLLRLALARERIDLRLRIAAEVRLDESIPARLTEDPALSLDGGGRYLLLELPHDTIPPALARFLFELQASGTTPVIAHPERNTAVRKNPAIAADWVKHGAMLQLTAGSIDGSFGRPIGACSHRLLRSGRVHVIATDAHRATRRPPRLLPAIAAAQQIVGESGARQLVLDNPRAILRGATADTVLAAQPRPQGRRLFGLLHR